MNTDSIEQDVLDNGGKKVGSINLPSKIFAARVYPDLVHEAVRWQRAKRRAGTHSVLTRSNMKGGGKKPFKQKGTGNARAGSNISPLWVGGASVHGPSPRKYEFTMPRKSRQAALFSVLTEKRSKSALMVLDNLAVESGKTKDMCAILQGLGLANKKVVVVVSDKQAEADQKVIRATKNIDRVIAVPVAGLNVYDLINADAIVGSKGAIEALKQRFEDKAGV